MILCWYYDPKTGKFYHDDDRLPAGFHDKQDVKKPVEPECPHVWQTYCGFREDYQFCTVCDVKKPINE